MWDNIRFGMLAVGMIGLSVSGALGLDQWTPYAVCIFNIFIIILMATNRMPVKLYPYFIWLIAVTMLLQNTMLGATVVGSDVQGELFASRLSLSQGWDNQYPYSQSNVSPVVGLLAPFITKVTFIPIMWVYKLVFPVIFSFTPVILYFIYKKMVSEKTAWYAAVFFTIMPTFWMEIGQIGKAMIAEPLLALLLWILVSDRGTWYKITFGSLLAIGVVLSHYTVGMILILFIMGIVGVALLAKFIKWGLWVKAKTSVIVLMTILVVSCGTFYFYYSKAYSGVIWTVIANNFTNYSKVVTNAVTTNGEEVQTPLVVNIGGEILTSRVFINPDIKAEPAVQIATGQDFAQSTVVGKIFRILQWLTELAIVAGAIYVLFRWKKFSFPTEWIGGIGVSFIILALCVFMPEFSRLINMTRWYHYVLFIIAPLFVIGGSLFKPKIVLPVLVIVYFIFTSGMMFNLSNKTSQSRLEIPYSMAIGGWQNGLVGVFNKTDLKCAEWLNNESDQSIPVVSDISGFYLLDSYIPLAPRLKDTMLTLRLTIKDVPITNRTTYIYISSSSAETGRYSETGMGSGLRNVNRLPDWLKELPVYFQCDNAKVYLYERK